MGFPSDEPVREETPPADRPALRLTEASEARERRCADCGKTTTAWKPVRRKGTSVLVCAECAAKPPPTVAGGCPSCGAAIADDDVFCGKCGARRSLECPTCHTPFEAGDAFCGKCGAKLGEGPRKSGPSGI